MDNVLIDTDVILDFFFDRHPFSEFASGIFSLCESKVIQGFLTPFICSNVYYLLRQTARHEKVVAKLKQLLTITEVLLMDKTIITRALSSDFKDFKNSPIAVMTPDSYLKIMFSKG